MNRERRIPLGFEAAYVAAHTNHTLRTGRLEAHAYRVMDFVMTEQMRKSSLLVSSIRVGGREQLLTCSSLPIATLEGVSIDLDTVQRGESIEVVIENPSAGMSVYLSVRGVALT